MFLKVVMICTCLWTDKHRSRNLTCLTRPCWVCWVLIFVPLEAGSVPLSTSRDHVTCLLQCSEMFRKTSWDAMYFGDYSVFMGSFNFTFNHIIPICHFLQIDTIHSYHYTSTLSTFRINTCPVPDFKSPFTQCVSEVNVAASTRYQLKYLGHIYTTQILHTV